MGPQQIGHLVSDAEHCLQVTRWAQGRKTIQISLSIHILHCFSLCSFRSFSSGSSSEGIKYIYIYLHTLAPLHKIFPIQQQFLWLKDKTEFIHYIVFVNVELFYFNRANTKSSKIYKIYTMCAKQRVEQYLCTLCRFFFYCFSLCLKRPPVYRSTFEINHK